MLLLESSFSLFFGRFHPVFVHLPIGFLLLAMLMEFFNSKAQSKNMDAAILFALKLGVGSTVIAASMGWLLASEGGYNESHLFWHRWLGIGVGVLAMLALAIKSGTLALPDGIYKIGLLGMAGLLAATGHLGGNMTHGAAYLTEYLPFGNPKETVTQKAFNNPDSVFVYHDLIEPMLEKRCFECHNQDKDNGGLQLHTAELLSKGGDGGPVLVNGKAIDSELFERITKDPTSKKFMPTGGKTHLGFDEVKLIGWWIDEGASFDLPISEMEIPKDVQHILEDKLKVSLTKKSYVETATVAPIATTIMDNLAKLGFSGSPLANGNNFLDIRYNKLGTTPSTSDLEALAQTKAQITWLNLANRSINDEMLTIIGTFSNLTRLQIQQNPITDKGIAALANLKNLESLNLYGTEVTDAALNTIEQLPNLEKLFLWQTKVTPEGVENLQNKLPKLKIELGTSMANKL
ncbi:MAG: c-type cytochrome domain-containing protein [Saprospiraceae bacterium]